MLASSQKQMEDYKSKQTSKDKQRDIANQRLLDEAMKKKVAKFWSKNISLWEVLDLLSYLCIE